MSKFTQIEERVARAICKEAGRDPDKIHVAVPGHPEFDRPWWQTYGSQAKAAILVICEPVEIDYNG